MGSILSFRPRAAHHSPKRKEGDAVATVVIVPGVRYERQKPATAGSAVVRSGSRPGLPQAGS